MSDQVRPSSGNPRNKPRPICLGSIRVPAPKDVPFPGHRQGMSLTGAGTLAASSAERPLHECAETRGFRSGGARSCGQKPPRDRARPRHLAGAGLRYLQISTSTQLRVERRRSEFATTANEAPMSAAMAPHKLARPAKVITTKIAFMPSEKTMFSRMMASVRLA